MDVFRLGVWLLLLVVVFVPLERFFAQRPQPIFRKEFLTDLGYYFLNSLLPKLLLILPMSLIAQVVHFFLPSSFYAWIAGLPILLRFVAAILVGEFGAYWGHRWSHTIPLLWRFHAIHHSAEQMDWLVNTRAHPLDMVFTRFCGLLPIYLLGLGQPTGQAVDVDIVPMLYAVVGTVWSFFVHANIRWRFGWIEVLVATPAFHHWHHTKDGAEFINKNYAAIFPWVDKLFGSFYLPPNQWPTRYGIEEALAPNLAGQLLQPLENR